MHCFILLFFARYNSHFARLKPYNFERILFYLTDGNTALIKQWMDTMEETQKLTLESNWHEKIKLDFQSSRITDDETCNALQRISKKFDYVVDPHTAVAIAAADKLGYPVFQDIEQDDTFPIVILATASPCKFQETVTVALGQDGWDMYRQHEFPVRALRTLEMKEIEPYHFSWPEGAELSEVQADWQKKMLKIVEENFRLN